MANVNTLLRAWALHLPILLILAWWLYDLQFQWRALPEYQYGWLVVILAGYLIWDRWESIPNPGRAVSFWLCAGFSVAGTPFVLVAELYKQAIANTPAASFCLSIGCALYLMGGILYLHGWRVLKHFLFPLAFLFLAVPLPGILWTPVVLVLKEFVTLLNVETLNLMGIPAAQQGNVIRLPNCVVGVDEACSGVRSLQSSLMAGLFIGNLTFKRLGSQAAFFLLALALALLGNFLRSLFLSMTAYRHGVQELDKWHDTAGWTVFIFTTGGLIASAWFIGRFEKRLRLATTVLPNSGSAQAPKDSQSNGESEASP